MKKTLFLFLMFFVATSASANDLIWLDTATKAELQQQVTNNTTEWQALKTWCDDNIDADLDASYQYLGWFYYVRNYGMCYQMTGDETYATEGVKYFTALLRDKTAIGDGLGGATAIQVDSGWVARSLGSGVAMGRDWLRGSTALTAALVAEAVARLGDWFTWYEASGFSKADPHDNYFAGYFAMTYLSGYAFEGDTANALTWQSNATTMWNTLVLPAINGYLDGGDWQEGWNYAEWATVEYMQYPLTLETAKGDSSKWADTNWYSDLVQSKIHMLYPGRGSSSDDGSWSGSLKGNPNTQLLTYLLKEAPITAHEKGLASWYKDNLTYDPYPIKELEAFMWRDTTAEIAPAEATDGLSRLITGTSRVLSRASWLSDDATFVEFAAPDTGSATQGEMNVGEFKIASRRNLLVVDADTWEASGVYGNVLLINGSHTYAPSQEWWRDGVSIDRYISTTDYMYARANNLEKAYDGSTSAAPSASSYSREVLFIYPDYVFVMDNVIPMNQATNTITSQVNFMGEPTISGNTLTVANGTAKVFMKVVGHDVTLSKEDRSSKRSGVWRADITPMSTASQYNLLHIFETAGSTKTTMDTVTDIIGTGCVGATIGDETAVFTSTSDPAYTTGSAGTQTIVGLDASTIYTVVTTGSNISTTDITSSTAGVVTFDLANAGSTTVSLNGGEIVVETCSDGIQNQDETGIDCGGSCDACETTPTYSAFTMGGDVYILKLKN